MKSFLLTEPQQARSIAKVQAIEAAVHSIIGGHERWSGYQEVTTNNIAEVANVDISTLYRFFASKEDIVMHCLQKTVMELDEKNKHNSRWTQGDPKKSVWWRGADLQKMVFIETVRWYTPETQVYVEEYIKKAENRVVKTMKDLGAKGDQKDWRVSIRFISYIQAGVLWKVRNSKSSTITKRVIDQYEESSRILIAQYFT